MKHISVLFLFAIFACLYSTMWINPASEINFGPTDFSIYGGIKVGDLKDSGKIQNKSAGAHFDTNSRIVFIGASEDNLENIPLLHNVTVDKPSGNLSLNQNLYITGNIDFIRGSVVTGADTLVLSLPTTTLTGESSNGYLLGNVRSSRSVGTGSSAASGHFGGIGFKINNSGNNIGTVTVYRKTGSGSHVNILDSDGILRQWKVETSVPFTGTRSVSADWFKAEDNGNRPIGMKVWKYNQNKSGDWLKIEGTVLSETASARSATFELDEATVFTVNNTDTYFAVGKGNANEPWLIRTAQNLDSIRIFLGAENDTCFFKQIADIDLDVAPFNTGSGWEPLGSFAEPFMANYDGDGYKIDNLFINKPGQDWTGLFGYLNGAYLSNMLVTNASVIGRFNSGILAGTAMGNTQVHYSMTSGAVTAQDYTGGFIGETSNTNIFYCYSTADVTGENFTGGLIGYDFNSYLSTSYAYGNVSGVSSVGGLLGYSNETDFYHVYSIGQVTASGGSDGGLTGYSFMSTYFNCYWDMETSLLDYSGGGEGRTTEEMTFPHDEFNTYSGWDFYSGWHINYGINNGYPYLQWQDLPSSNFAGGNGDWEYPYLVATPEQLNMVRYYKEKHFRQIADINLNVIPYNTGEGWEPIGSSDSDSFGGNYNGGGYRVSNLYINRPSQDYTGLFGYAENLWIDSLNVTGADITGRDHSGIMMGYGKFTNANTSSVSGSVSGRDNTGGMAGTLEGSSFYQSFSVADVASTGTNSGGLIGEINDWSNIYECYSKGSVSGVDRTGGLAGSMENANVTHCYSAVVVNGTGSDVGGLVGYVDAGYVDSSYWDTDVSGQLTSASGEGRTTAKMTFPYDDNDTYEGWDFTWVPAWICQAGVNDGYPYLHWQIFDPWSIIITVADGNVNITWDPLTGATGYVVYSSADPYGTFTIDETGSFTAQTEWQAPLPGPRMFYFVKASFNAKNKTVRLNID